MRRTRVQVAVAVALMADPHGRHWGYELSRAAGVSSGAMYQLLTRFLEQGLLTDGWEDPQERSGRPPRRYYELSDAGRSELGAIAAAAPPEMHAAVTRARNAAQSRPGTPKTLHPRPAILQTHPLDPRPLIAKLARRTGWGAA